MNRIDTSFAVDPSIQQPFTVKSLDFLQDANKEMVNALCKSMIRQAGYIYSGSIPYRIFASATIRYIFFNDELYFMQPPVGGDNIAVLITIPDPNADPLTFTDNVARNVHNQRILDPQNGSLGTGLFDLVNIVDISSTVSGVTLLNSWTVSGTAPTYEVRNNRVFINGGVSKAGGSSGIIMQLLPAPSVQRTVTVNSASGAGYTPNSLIIDTSGNVTLAANPGVTTGIQFDGCNYSL